jgi:hypothetical protein
MATNSPTVYNEKIKLYANALDRASTACLTLGVFGPLTAHYIQGTGALTWQNAVTVIAWWLAGLTLHLRAQRELDEMI